MLNLNVNIVNDIFMEVSQNSLLPIGPNYVLNLYSTQLSPALSIPLIDVSTKIDRYNEFLIFGNTLTAGNGYYNYKVLGTGAYSAITLNSGKCIITGNTIAVTYAQAYSATTIFINNTI
jgi:hypothetical protein